MTTLSLDAIRANAIQLASHIRRTPSLHWDGPVAEELVGTNGELHLKLELLQNTGTFKLRGALTVMLNQRPEDLARGVTAVSAGNHAIAVACAAARLGVSAKVVMLEKSNPLRVEKCREFGAEIVLAETVHAAFDAVRKIAEQEERIFVHPFEGPWTALGTATLGLEFLQQVPTLDAVIVPIGGGGLCGGVSAAIKAVKRNCRVYGVEPTGADNMYRSFAAGQPVANESIRTIADSLGPPASEPYSFGLCHANVDEIVLINDADMIDGMKLMFRELKLAVEPAAAASTAALRGPLRKKLRGQRVGLIVCGSNIDVASYTALLNDRG